MDDELSNMSSASAFKQAPHILVHSVKDNVAVVVMEGLKAGTEATGIIIEDNSQLNIMLKQEVPLGHKIAIRDLYAGDAVIKYGQDIGVITQSVAKGKHVHTHNLKTKRW